MKRLISAMFLATVLILFEAESANAAGQIRFVDRAGKAISSLSVSMPIQPGGTSPFAAQSPEMTQSGSLFAPYILTVPTGAQVSFPNFDPYKHHVYSFSSTKRFELKLYGNDENRSIVFDKAGTVALGCNIHDNMLAFVRVSPNAAVAGVSDDGVLDLVGDMPDNWTLEIWHPDLDRKAKGVKDGVYTLSGSGNPNAPVVIPLRKRRTVQKDPSDRNY